MNPGFLRSQIVEVCCHCFDMFDKSDNKKLSFGNTFGNALEAAVSGGKARKDLRAGGSVLWSSGKRFKYVRDERQ